MKLGALISLRATQMILRLARAELAKVLCRLGDYIGEELELNTSERFTLTIPRQPLLHL
jgi:hypothetical protein